MRNLEEYLRKLAAQPRSRDEEDWNPFDYSGGDYGYAYSMGCSDGEITLAREIVKEFYDEAEKGVK